VPGGPLGEQSVGVPWAPWPVVILSWRPATSFALALKFSLTPLFGLRALGKIGPVFRGR
jgi:hypothetical protein